MVYGSTKDGKKFVYGDSHIDKVPVGGYFSGGELEFSDLAMGRLHTIVCRVMGRESVHRASMYGSTWSDLVTYFE